jgi:hypothetical protein
MDEGQCRYPQEFPSWFVTWAVQFLPPADDAEAPAKSVFLMGYSVGPLTGVLEKLLQACGFPKGKVGSLARF